MQPHFNPATAPQWTADAFMESCRLSAMDAHLDDREPGDWEPCHLYFDEED